MLRDLPAKLFSPKFGFYAFSLVILVSYCFIPFFVNLYYSGNEYFLQLSILTICAVTFMIIGFKMPIIDGRFRDGALRIGVGSFTLNFCVWSFFLIFATYTFWTATSIPLFSALQGASADTLSQERGDFFKGRSGAETALLYLSTIFTTVLIPYSIVLAYMKKSPFRHLFIMCAFFFCISFLQKSLFLNVLLPLLVCLAITNKLSIKSLVFCVLGMICLLVFAVYLTVDESTAVRRVLDITVYFSSEYVPSDSGDYFLWRVIAVPIFTASDTLLVHTQQFGDYLMGATSTLISAIFGMERINIERYVFQHQFGGWNDIANANAVFVTDAYVNFGWAGVILFSLFIGQVFRWFNMSKDIAFKSLWPVFALTLYSASLIGMLISNGFAIILLHGLMVRVKYVRS
ncbi:hypothetical protein [Pseudomonas sp. HY7a-MNA-CIBAN-0227]|uniref:hypothetical protein n=1 Tax=Pseudomonas sp. HY7a-MNA-CIBAN-0227 TaxID=3140474 RepID=UPI00331E7F86